VSKLVKWEDFVRKGYHVIPPEKEALRSPAYFRWFAEDRHKDVPEPLPLPSQWAGDFGKGLSTQSGKIEFIPSSLKRGDPDNPERPAVNRYVPSWEGLQTTGLVSRYPLQMLSTHSRYSFHTYGDGKDSTLNDIDDHRVKVDGYAYWVMRVNSMDATARGIHHHDLIRVFNDRGSVICAADVSPLVAPGVCKSYESSAEVEFFDDPRFGRVDRGGCVNVLTPRRPQVKNTEGMGSNSCLVEFERWAFASGELKRA
jgi:anaerobic selenocysteine-containing dehydrogenase